MQKIQVQCPDLKWAEQPNQLYGALVFVLIFSVTSEALLVILQNKSITVNDSRFHKTLKHTQFFFQPFAVAGTKKYKLSEIILLWHN